MEILIGTKNQFKASQMIWCLQGLPGINIHTLEELNTDVEITEDGRTLLDNAEKKAREISQFTKWCVLASDRGIDIPGLGGRWDILRSQRIVGEHKTDREKVDTLLGLMQGLKGEGRLATDHFALSLALGGKVIWSEEIIVDRGYVVEKADEGDIPKSYWVGHIWYYPQYGKVFNKLSIEEKNKVIEQQIPLRIQLQEAIRRIESY